MSPETSGLRILKAAGRRAERWKNGADNTSDVAAVPPGAGTEAFDWQINNVAMAALRFTQWGRRL